MLSALELDGTVKPPFAPVVSGQPPLGAITYRPLSEHVNEVLTAELLAWKIRLLGDPVVVDGLRGDPPFCAVPVPDPAPNPAPSGTSEPDAAYGIADVTGASSVRVKGSAARLLRFFTSPLADDERPAAASPPAQPPAQQPPPARTELRSAGGVPPDEPTGTATTRLGLGALGAFVLDAAVFVWSEGWQPEQPADGGRAFEVLDAELDLAAGRLRAHLRFRDPGAWHFVQAQQPDRPAFAFMLPPGTPGDGDPVFALDLVCDRDGTVIDAQALLSERNAGPLARAAELCAAAQRPGAAPALPADVPADAPLARTVVAAPAFRADRLDELGPAWLDGLALESPYSDAAVFRLRALAGEEPFDAHAALPYIEALARNGSPCTSEGFGQIVRLFELFFEPGADGEPPLLDMHAELLPPNWRAFRAHVATIARSFRGSGLFVSFASTAEQLKLIRGAIA
jgi:hypothetical protein